MDELEKKQRNLKYTFGRSIRAKEKYRNNPELKRRSVVHKHGLTVEAYDALMEVQGGVCKICGNPQIDKALYIDHDHFTGRIRGLLCNNCNTGLGMFKDNSELLGNAIKYLDGTL